MTLRLRLVVALVALVTVGLSVFGVATYSRYAASEYARHDESLRNQVPLLTRSLKTEAGLESRPFPQPPDGSTTTGTRPTGSAPGPDRGGPTVVAPDAFGQLRDATGTILSSQKLGDDATVVPSLPADLQPDPEGHPFTTGSVNGDVEWRVVVMPADLPGGGGMVVVAVPLTDVSERLQQLVLIEATAAAALLVALAAGSWFVLRRGLRPLERMATTASTITAGDLSVRVSPADGTTEVGQLGLALNTMLGEIEQSFQERDATERRLRQFLADASHELRTPLTSIQGFAELFRVGSDLDHVNLEIIMRRIEEESARMKDLVEDLLLLARLDQTRETDRAPVDLAVLAADACSDAVAMAPDRAVTLDAPDPVIVLGVADHLRQAIGNLVTNALKHTPAGSPIEVQARIDGGLATVVVADHGGGLDAEALAHVFDRFWQADAARVGAGAGLGLAIVSGIAAEHGGEVVAANREGGGARFSLRLPIVALSEPRLGESVDH